MPRDYRYLADRLAPHILHDAREWLRVVVIPMLAASLDYQPPWAIVQILDRHWHGGLHAFIATSFLRDQDPFIREPITLEIAP